MEGANDFSDRSSFDYREHELANAVSFLLLKEAHPESRLLTIAGDSGTGKTTLCRKVLQQVKSDGVDCLLICLDLLNDEFITSSLFESLICLCWNAYASFPPTDLLKVPKGRSFSDFIKRKRMTGSGINALYAAVKQSAALIPGFKAALSALPEKIASSEQQKGNTPDFTHLFSAYLEWVARRHPVFIALDNYQYLNPRVRILFESRVGHTTNGLRLIIVDRTEAAISRLGSVICFPEHRLLVRVEPFSKLQTEQFVQKTLGDPSETSKAIGRDCYFKTQGNPKLVELYLKARDVTADGNERDLPGTLAETIDGLPLVARSIMLLTTIFTAGLRRRYVEMTLRRLTAGPASNAIRLVLEELIALGYIIVNGGNNEMVRIAHEKVLNAMKSSVTESEILEMRALTLATFDEAIASGISDEEYFYVLHCLVGILHLQEALARIDKVASLVNHQHSMARYEYVAMIQKSNPKLIGSLPTMTVKLVLDSLQKICEFSVGYAAIHELQASGFEDGEVLKLFSAKYEVQTYHPDEALASLEKVRISPTNLMIQLNALLCLAEDDRAREVLQALESFPDSEELYIGLRNTAHLFSYDTAVKHQLRSHEYFKRLGKRFVLATVLNNLGAVYLCAQKHEDAERALSAAEKTMQALGSSEVFESKINLGVLALQRKQFERAISYFKDSRSYIPRELLLDKIAVDQNVLITQLIRADISRESVAADIEDLYYDSLQIRDPRLHDILAYNYTVLAPNPDPTISPRADFLSLVFESDLMATEVKIAWELMNQPLLAILSPHWRY